MEVLIRGMSSLSVYVLIRRLMHCLCYTILHYHSYYIAFYCISRLYGYFFFSFYSYKVKLMGLLFKHSLMLLEMKTKTDSDIDMKAANYDYLILFVYVYLYKYSICRHASLYTQCLICCSFIVIN